MSSDEKMRRSKLHLLISILFLLSGCVSFSVNPRPYPSTGQPTSPQAERPSPHHGEVAGKTAGTATPAGKTPETSSHTPRQVASLRLVDHGEREIHAGHYNRGISLLERAISLDGYNGRAYYLLALAWQEKGEPRRALGFAQKAELLFQRNPAKLKKVYEMESRIYESLGQPEKAGQYRDKAKK
jgi:hypothetical protein